MTTVTDFYVQAAAVVDPQQRRWAVGAAYRLDEAVRIYGDTYASARTRILSVPQYANGLSAAGLTAAFNAIDGVGGTGGPTLLTATTMLSSTSSLVAGGLA